MSISLYVVSTPIGNLEDFSERGRKILSNVEYILCEDTRITARLLDRIGIRKKLLVYNDHNAVTSIPYIISSMLSGVVYAQVSDAGTPLISDPGYKLINACIENNLQYTAIPGACATINALLLSGFPCDKFLFAGFVDHANLESLASVNATIILYESPMKLVRTLERMSQYFENRNIAVVREMTKVHEEVIRGSIDEVRTHFSINRPQGELVIVITPPIKNFDEIEKYDEIITMLAKTVPLKKIANTLSKVIRMPKNVVYNHIKALLNE